MLGGFPLPRCKAPGVWQMKTGQLVVLVTAEARASGVICENSDLTCISTGRSALFNFPHRPLALSHRATTRAEMAKKVADDAEPAGLTNRAELQGQIPSDLSATDLFVPKSRMPPFTCYFLGDPIMANSRTQQPGNEQTTSPEPSWGSQAQRLFPYCLPTHRVQTLQGTSLSSLLPQQCQSPLASD